MKLVDSLIESFLAEKKYRNRLIGNGKSRKNGDWGKLNKIAEIRTRVLTGWYWLWRRNSVTSPGAVYWGPWIRLRVRVDPCHGSTTLYTVVTSTDGQ